MTPSEPRLVSAAGSFPVPPWLIEHARGFYAAGGTPVAPRVAATVVLLRPAGTGFEVYAIRRAATMAFASGMYAFPGGSVDPRDATGAVAWSGPSDVDWGVRLGLEPAAARAVVCAAVRELFEEAGVLLSNVEDVRDARWEEARQALVSRERSLSEFLAARDLVLRSELLVPWARWITPEFEPRRFDTYFFLAVVPAGQEPRDVSGEADHTMWVRPADALADPNVVMLPPTSVTLRELAVLPDVASAFAAAGQRDVATPVVPRLDPLLLPPP
jgi:8-oxo-dGTP pyrophosphatase MutT (NUDIX family)